MLDSVLMIPANGCSLTFQAQRGVLFVFDEHQNCLLRISGLSPEQFECEMIDVRAAQPRSHNETLYGYSQDGPLPEEIAAEGPLYKRQRR
jgi:hypothetical protein